MKQYRPHIIILCISVAVLILYFALGLFPVTVQIAKDTGSRIQSMVSRKDPVFNELDEGTQAPEEVNGTEGFDGTETNNGTEEGTETFDEPTTEGTEEPSTEDIEDTENAEETEETEDTENTETAENPESPGGEDPSIGGDFSFFNNSDGSVPSDIAAATQRAYSITSYTDWVNLCKISRQSDLEGFTFTVWMNEDTDKLEYDLGNPPAGYTGDVFTGIGSAAYPFAGTLVNGMDYGAAIKTNVPLFSYLSSKAVVGQQKAGADTTQFRIEADHASAGLAQNYVVDAGQPVLTGDQFHNIILTGSLNSTTVPVGGLFGVVEAPAGTTFVYEDSNLTVDMSGLTIQGHVAGGLFGQVNCSMELVIDRPELVNLNVQSTADTTKGKSLGGFVGTMGDGSSTLNLTISSNRADGITVNNNVNYDEGTEKKRAYGNVGGMFGSVVNTAIEVDTLFTYTGSGSKDQPTLCGTSIGGFAGSLDESPLTFHKSAVFSGIVLYPSNDSTIHQGGVVGYTDKSPIKTTDGARVEVSGLMAVGHDNVSGYSGGLVGYAYKTALDFDEGRECIVTGFVTEGNLYGSIGGVVGRFRSSSDGKIIKGMIAGENTIKGRSPSDIGGLVGKIELDKNRNVTVEKIYIGDLKFSCGGGAGLIVGEVGYVDGVTEGSVTIANVVIDSSLTYSGSEGAQGVGGIIGIAKTDAVIGDAAVSYVIKSDFDAEYFGGIIGRIEEPKSGIRSVDIRNVTVGDGSYMEKKSFTTAYGGLVGYAGPGVSLCLDGDIRQNGGTGTVFSAAAGKTSVTVGGQAPCLNTTEAAFYGHAVGELNDALVYLQPTANWEKSAAYRCNEVGNYGGVVRNGNWNTGGPDPAAGDNSTWLIRDHVPKGTLSFAADGCSLGSVADWLRIAIAMNTSGRFMPEGLTYESYAYLRSYRYTVTADVDLTGTGLGCLSRNAQKPDIGWTDSVFAGSIDGGGHSVTYGFTSYGQNYLGLFPAYLGSSDGSTFNSIKNLDLIYDYRFELPAYSTGSGAMKEIDGMRNYSQQAGGFAATAAGPVYFEKVSYVGTLSDGEDNGLNSFGGLIGYFTGSSGTAITMKDISAGIEFYHNNLYNHIFGGVIGYVDTAGVSAGAPMAVQMTGVKLGGTLTLASQGKWSCEFRDGGLIAMIGYEDTAQKRCTLELSDISVNNMTFQADSAQCGGNRAGGFLGYSWRGIDAKISNVEIGVTGQALWKGNMSFGGLLYYAQGKMAIQDLTMGSRLRVDAVNSTENSGLIIKDTRKLYMGLTNYKIVSGAVLANYAGSSFDEVAGITQESGSETGGIVSINRSANGSSVYWNASSYESYAIASKLTYENCSKGPHTNANTRYYYDLNTKVSYEGYKAGMLDSPEDLMGWHLMHYADSSIRSYMDESYTSIQSLPQAYVISGKIDLAGYSYYPTPILRAETYTGQGASIIFHADTITDGEKRYQTGSASLGKYPTDKAAQHYQMHGGLFGNVKGINVSGISLKGAFAAHDGTSGALICGSIRGDYNDAIGEYNTENTISHIVLQDLWCVTDENYGSPAGQPYGLLIARIDSKAKVTFEDVQAAGKSGALSPGGKSAASLIGEVGDSNATNIALNFNHMDIQESIMTDSTLMYRYEYRENSTAIYTFTYDDYVYGAHILTPPAGNQELYCVTLGKELGQNGSYAQVEYYDEDMPVGQLKDKDKAKETGFNPDDHIPYVKDAKQVIIVNPKIGHLLEGCGTYEDPYVIENNRQFLTLYRYLCKEADYADLLKSQEWTINTPGDDTSLCPGTGHTQRTYVQMSVNNDTNKLYKQMLSQAYYVITKDIDLTNYTEFTGFGTKDMPFVGVFVGNKAEGQQPSIIMPYQYDETGGRYFELSDFGLIAFAKGTVVKDLNIEFNGQIYVQNTGGGVIATVLGGENIIDNVTVRGKDEGSGVTDAVLYARMNTSLTGGYVGVVKLGGVILRNMTGENLKHYKSIQSYSNEAGLFQGGIAGKVEDGYVVYDGTSEASVPLMKDMSRFSAEGFCGRDANDQPLPVCRSYDILNGAYLKSNCGAGVTWTGSGFEIAGGAQLQVMSMALNSGLLNYLDGVNELRGYDNASRQRNGDYDSIGKVASASNAAYRDVIDNDNLVKNDSLNPRWNNAQIAGRKNRFLDSWLMQFINWNSNIFRDDYKLCLNPIPETAYQTQPPTWTLTGTTYDMTVYGSAFRGLGARYNNGVNEWGGTPNVFGGHLKGRSAASKAEIKLGMLVDEGHDTWNAALINSLPRMNYYNNYSNIVTLQVENLVLSGTVVNTYGIAAGLVGTNNVYLSVSNVDLQGISVQGGPDANAPETWRPYYAGGYVAYNATNKISFTNCSIKPVEGKTKEESNTIAAKGYAGGFVGSYSATTTGLTFDGIQIDGISVYAYWNRTARAGGLVGMLYGMANTPVQVGTQSGAEGSGVTGSHMAVDVYGEYGCAGGLIGYIENSAYYTSKVYNVTLTDLHVVNNDTTVRNTQTEDSGVGGIVGVADCRIDMEKVTVGSREDADSTVFIQNKSLGAVQNYTSTNNGRVSASGGLVGAMKGKGSSYWPGVLVAQDCEVLGCGRADGSYTTQILGNGHTGGITSLCGGGFSGSHISQMTRVTVAGAEIKGGYFVGGLIGYRVQYETLPIQECRVEDCLIGISEEAARQNDSDVGGLIGCADASTTRFLGTSVVSRVVIDPTYTRYAGGAIGYVPNGRCIDMRAGSALQIEDCTLMGRYVGGVFGYINRNGNATELVCRSISVVDSRIIACHTNNPDKTFVDLSAGAFAGAVRRGDKAPVSVDKMEASGNLIAVDTPPLTERFYLGGLIGMLSAHINFYDVDLKDNYIGMLDKADCKDDFPELGESGSAAAWMEILRTAPIADLRDYLKAVTQWTSAVRNTVKYTEFAQAAESELYRYSFQEGALVGDNTCTYNSSYINVNVQYTDNAFRPVSDVGINYANFGSTLDSTEKMYDIYRQEYLIVYDSYQTEAEKVYSFLNLETPIMSQYAESRREDSGTAKKDERYIYRLNADLQDTFAATYRGEDEQGRGFLKVNNLGDAMLPSAVTLPVAVYSSGDLDQLISEYLDMLTNCSNTMHFADSEAGSGPLVSVGTTAMKIENGRLQEDTGRTPCIQVENSGDAIHFTNSSDSGRTRYDSAELEFENTNGTFTMVRFSYLWNNEVRWVVEIPVFVERKLEIASNMRMLSGLTYNMGALRSSDYYYNEEHTVRYTIDSGSSYTLYAEFVYNDARAKYDNKHIAKTIYLTNEEGNKDKDIYFVKGTRLTLIDISDGGKAYHYNVEENCDNIAFSDFVAVRSQKEDRETPYAYLDLGALQALGTHQDVCGNTYEDVAREQYVLLVDTSQVDISNRRVSYEIHIKSTNLDKDFFGRAEHLEHCYEKVMEIDRITASIYEEENRTFCEENSFIGENGNVLLHLDYNVLLPEAYKQNHRGTHRNLDVAIYLGIRMEDSSQVVRVPLPAGTKVIDLEHNNQSYVVESNSGQVYYYSQLNSGTEAGRRSDVMDNVQQDVLTDFGIYVQLDFSEADMSFIESMQGEFYIGADLVLGPVTDAPSFGEPPRDGDILDTRQIHVNTINSDVGFAVLPSEVMTLGINRYHPEATDEGVISFTTKVALPENYRDVGGIGKYYSVVYTLEEKVAENAAGGKAVSYRPYTGNDIRLYCGSGEEKITVIGRNAGTADPLVPRTGMLSYRYASGGRKVTEFAIGGVAAQEGGFVTVDTENGVVSIEGTVEVNTDGSLDWSNYRIKAYLVVSDSAFGAGMTEMEWYDYVKTEQELQTDWFVFTIAKVKTDME